MTSKADQAISLLGGFVQLAKTRQLPACGKICRRTFVPFSLLFIQHTPAQTSSDTDDTVEPVSTDETSPLLANIEFVLCGHQIG